MAIQIVTDSASDFLPQEAEALGIHVIPMTINFGGQDFVDGIDLTHDGFFEKLVESDIFPTTSLITPDSYHKVFDKLTENGDTVIAITLSSKLSGTYQSACIAAEDFGDKVYVVDSLNATVAQRLLVLTCLDYCREGYTAKEITDRLNADKKEICFLALMDTLEYLKKGGRISPTVAFAGELLSIKPVIAIEDGAVSLVGKARGSKNGNNLLRKLIDDVGGIDFSRHYGLIYSGLSDHLLQKYIEDSADLREDKVDELPISTLGAVIGTHIGPGAIGVAFFRSK
ncbi:MAG: DegV family protein [Clostridia bacterium]|nr:DegV family protein [Clostridia bacterium]